MRYLKFITYIKIQNLIRRLFYLKWKDFIDKTEFQDKDSLRDFQFQKVKELLDHSYEHIPYYRELFDNNKIQVSAITSLEDFRKIPFLTKDEIRANPNKFISDKEENKHLYFYTTGGSTGQPLGFYRHPRMDAIEEAFMNHQWGRIGFKESSKRVILRGEPLKENLLFSKYRFDNVWLMSSYHLTKENIFKYVEQLNKIKPDFLHVYPTSLFVFTQLLLESGLKLKFSLKGILCGSEPVFDHQRNLFEETYNTRVYSWLGQAEGAVLAGECEHSTKYHVWPQHSYVELIDENGNPVTEKGKSGEIVGTTINNLEAPFIRYKTGDIGIYEDDHCSECGRNFMILKKVEGRVQDYAYLTDGSKFPINPVIFGIHHDVWKYVRRIQIIQEEFGKIKVVVEANNRKVASEMLKNLLDKRIGNVLQYQIDFDIEIERTKAGKHKLLIQKNQQQIS